MEDTSVSISVLSRSGPILVGKLPHLPGGVDFLGLRQVNLDLMQQLLPTVNNVVSHVRIYTLLAWAWWKAVELGRARGDDEINAAEIRSFVDRVEILFTWSHLLNGVSGELPGITKKPPVSSSKVALDLESWKRERTTATLMAPVQYGPSLRFPNGFRYVESVPGFPTVLRPFDSVMPAIRHLDRKIAEADSSGLLATLKSVSAAEDEVKPLYGAWRFDRCHKVESEVFLQHFCDRSWRKSAAGQNDARWRRSRTVSFFVDVLRQAPQPLSIAEFRRVATSRRYSDERKWKPSTELMLAADIYLLLQARQGQRQALEILFSWVEAQLLQAPGRSPHDLARQAIHAFRSEAPELGHATSIRHIVELLHVEAKANGGLPEALGSTQNLDLFGLMDLTREVPRTGADDRLMAVATHLLVLSGLLAATQKQNDTLVSQFELSPGRVPLRVLVEMLDDAGDLEEAFRRVLADMVIGQHLSWAVARNTDETQRLRISLEEEGLVPLSAKPLRPLPTPDRLDNLFELLAEAGVCEAVETGTEPRYAARSNW